MRTSSSEGPREVHVVPHGGREVPAGLDGRFDDQAVETLAEHVFANCDFGTTRIARECLLEGARAGQATSVAVFRVSRVFLDANRLQSTEQVPANPYAGSGAPYRDYLMAKGSFLRESLLLPWLAGVNELLSECDTIAYHHHSYDVSGLAAREHDLRPFAPRPPAQFFWREPVVGMATEGGDELIPRAVVEAAARLLSPEYRDVGIDDPLVVPAMPWRGCVGSRFPSDRLWHLIYEVRKDLVQSYSGVNEWLASFRRVQETTRHAFARNRHATYRTDMQ